MPDDVLWDLDAHTGAKHRMLRAYLDAWIPIMANQSLVMKGEGVDSPRLLLVDGFAGPGRYKTGELGSPLIMLDALLSHDSFNKWSGVNFRFLFIEHDTRRIAHLRREVSLVNLPKNVVVQIEEGEFESKFGTIVRGVHERGKQLIPTFAFIDPFGYSDASMSLAGEFLDFPRCEAMFFLPLVDINRFVTRAGQERALTSLFGCEDWRVAESLPSAERPAFLLDLFKRQLGVQAAHVRSFNMRTARGRSYELVFALQHDRGLEIMKRAAWSVDPVNGLTFSATTDHGMEVLFEPAVNTMPLLEELRATFGSSWFAIEDAEAATRRTPFCITHLRRKTLAPAEKMGRLEVERLRGVKQFPSGRGIRLRLV